MLSVVEACPKEGSGARPDPTHKLGPFSVLPPYPFPIFTFSPKYLIPALVLLLVEILIAAFVRDSFIRPIGGDFLVVIMLYYFAKTFIRRPPWELGLGVLLFAYLIELAQYLHLTDLLGLSGNRIVVIVLGKQFSWEDMLAYTAGVAVVLGWEWWRTRKLTHQTGKS